MPTSPAPFQGTAGAHDGARTRARAGGAPSSRVHARTSLLHVPPAPSDCEAPRRGTPVWGRGWSARTLSTRARPHSLPHSPPTYSLTQDDDGGEDDAGEDDGGDDAGEDDGGDDAGEGAPGAGAGAAGEDDDDDGEEDDGKDEVEEEEEDDYDEGDDDDDDDEDGTPDDGEDEGEEDEEDDFTEDEEDDEVRAGGLGVWGWGGVGEKREERGGEGGWPFASASHLPILSPTLSLTLQDFEDDRDEEGADPPLGTAALVGAPIEDASGDEDFASGDEEEEEEVREREREERERGEERRGERGFRGPPALTQHAHTRRPLPLPLFPFLSASQSEGTDDDGEEEDAAPPPKKRARGGSAGGGSGRSGRSGRSREVTEEEEEEGTEEDE